MHRKLIRVGQTKGLLLAFMLPVVSSCKPTTLHVVLSFMSRYKMLHKLNTSSENLPLKLSSENYCNELIDSSRTGEVCEVVKE